MHIPLIYKAVTKPLETKNQLKNAQKLPMSTKILQKLKTFHENVCKTVHDFSTPHLNLIISSLGIEKPQITTKIDKTHKSIKQNT